jgi:hypothetical protein
MKFGDVDRQHAGNHAGSSLMVSRADNGNRAYEQIYRQG